MVVLVLSFSSQPPNKIAAPIFATWCQYMPLIPGLRRQRQANHLSFRTTRGNTETHMKIVKIDSLLPPCGILGLNSDHEDHGKCLYLLSHLNSPLYSFKLTSDEASVYHMLQTGAPRSIHTAGKVVERP